MGHDFRFEVVPLSEAPEAPEMPVEEEPPVVLVVDDEPLIADSLAAILSQSGLRVAKAYDGGAALEAALESPPQLLLTDVAMPGMNGVELAMAVAGAMPECQVLLFSAHGPVLDLAGARAAGFDFKVITKPLHPVEMLRRVFAALEATPVVRERRVTAMHAVAAWPMPEPANSTNG